MIVVDTSAIVALLFDEPEAPSVEATLLDHGCVMSAGTRLELGIVVEAKTGPAGTQLLEELLRRIDLQIIPVDDMTSIDALEGWRRFGKGRHRAGLNLGDTFAYTLASETGAPLLFVGDDFNHTDVRVAAETTAASSEDQPTAG